MVQLFGFTSQELQIVVLPLLELVFDLFFIVGGKSVRGRGNKILIYIITFLTHILLIRVLLVRTAIFEKDFNIEEKIENL
jgi:hypothetical protein